MRKLSSMFGCKTYAEPLYLAAIEGILSSDKPRQEAINPDNIEAVIAGFEAGSLKAYLVKLAEEVAFCLYNRHGSVAGELGPYLRSFFSSLTREVEQQTSHSDFRCAIKIIIDECTNDLLVPVYESLANIVYRYSYTHRNPLDGTSIPATPPESKPTSAIPEGHETFYQCAVVDADGKRHTACSTSATDTLKQIMEECPDAGTYSLETHYIKRKPCMNPNTHREEPTEKEILARKHHLTIEKGVDELNGLGWTYDSSIAEYCASLANSHYNALMQPGTAAAVCAAIRLHTRTIRRYLFRELNAIRPLNTQNQNAIYAWAKACVIVYGPDTVWSESFLNMFFKDLINEYRSSDDLHICIMFGKRT